MIKHLKNSNKLFKTIRKAEKVFKIGSDKIAFYIVMQKRWNFFGGKNNNKEPYF